MNKFLAILTLSILSQTVMAGIKVVYGPDNRKDVYQTPNTLHRKLAQSTAAMIHAGYFQKTGVNLFGLRQVSTLRDAANLCSQEAFANQPAAASCSGFLVAPDLLVTAGHCFLAQGTAEQNCKNFAWVFGFEKNSPSSNPTQNIPLNNIYLCKQIVSAELNNNLDYAIIKLDRPVVGRTPLRIRQGGKIPQNTSLVVIGHPTGIPTKISDGGKVTRNTEATTFSTTLDTFHGNSGSAVFNANSGMVEGILIQGKTDYVPSIANNPKSCQVVNRCDDNASNCTFKYDSPAIQYGEVVLRITTITSKINQALSSAQ